MKNTVLYSILGGLFVLVGCAERINTPSDLSGAQVLDLVVSIDNGALSKAPVSGVAFADGTHQFGVAITKADGLTAYEVGSGNILAKAEIVGGVQTWDYKWGAMPTAGALLPMLYGGDPMQLAGYYPHNAAAAADAGRDGGRINVPFDLTTAAERTEQTDVMYSKVQAVNFISEARQSVSLPFMHVYALLEFQVKLKTAGQPAKITKIEVCNKAGKDFVKNVGWFSPYTGELTASTTGNVSFETATEVVSATDFATIRMMVPPTLLAGYMDGDIYVQVYDDGAADPKEFPILKEYFIGSSTYGFTASGRYVYKLVYDNTGSGSLTVEGWFTSVASGDEVGGGASSGILSLKNWGASLSADATLGSGPPLPLFIEVNGLKWATGNLVAAGENSCKIGKPTDYGLYFQFGSLVGCSGGANGDGTGTGEPAPAVRVKPAGYSGSTSWPAGYYEGGTAGTGYVLPATDDPITGIGDPCRVYLGASWRTPTAAEWLTLIGASGANTNKGVPLTVNNTALSFPASGNRAGSNGAFNLVGSSGYFWSSSAYNSTSRGYSLSFDSQVYPQYNFTRASGAPVRCVSGELPPPTTPNPPTADQIVEIDGLSWTKGNLVAVNVSNCKVGAPTDYGLYFHFGSLVGWKGGSNGDGTGTGSPATEVQVKPASYGGTNDWTTAGYYKDGTAGTGYGLPATDTPTTGIGDPCRLYLGAPWRTPTADEWLALIGADGANTNKVVPLTVTGYALSFPASGYRNSSGGTFQAVGSNGYCWSSSVRSAASGYTLGFLKGNVNPQNSYDRSYGMPVRCVSGTYVPPTIPNPPTADQIVTVGSLKWTKGNLVAVNASNCKVGAATDYGLYFQFGSLVGWSSGANGDGTGTGEPALAVQVKPKGYSGGTAWTTAGRYKDGTAGTGYGLPADAPTTGIGDPCRVYLGAPWRTPTAAEWLTLLGASGANTNTSIPLELTGYDLSFPASGTRNDSDGAFNYVGSDGNYWSSSALTAPNGYHLYFYSGTVIPQYGLTRSNGMPVRCVASS